MLLLGNNVSLVFFGLFSAQVLEPVITSWGIDGGLLLFTQTILSTVVVLITAEFLPKAFVQMNPNAYLRFTTLPMFIVYLVLYIPTFIILGISNVFLKILKVDSSNVEKAFSKVDLEHYVQDINGR